MKNKMKHVSNEEKARHIVDVIFECSNNETFYEMAVKAAIQMAQCKDEIIKKTLESFVSAEVGYFNQHGLSIYFDKSLEKLGLEEGDKVKVLIIKE